jgi:hypothetical protein
MASSLLPSRRYRMNRKTIPLSEDNLTRGYVDFSIELIDQLTVAGVEEVILASNTGRYFLYLDDFDDIDIQEQVGVLGEGQWVKRMPIHKMVKA